MMRRTRWRLSSGRIVVYRALYLGDLICVTPALRALREGFPRAAITLIGLPWARELVDRLPYVDEFLPFPGYPGIAEVPYRAVETERFLERACASHYDLALQMHGDGHVSNGFVAALGARYTLGYSSAGDTRLSYSLAYQPDEHQIRRWLRLVGTLGVDVSDTRVEFPVYPAERQVALDLLRSAGESGPLVGIHPGAKDPTRRWPVERFAALADHLSAEYGARIVLTGAAHERDLTAAVRRVMRQPALDLAGTTQLGEFAALIASLDLLVTNDTGASHLAAASQTPSVVLFGPTRPVEWAPLDSSRHRVIDALGLTPGVEPISSLAQLELAPVYAACAALLDSAPARENDLVEGAIGADA